jgi:two-component system, chemotaxis family, sensor kinase CheA
VERVGGDIRIDNRPGAGASFTLSIPLTLTIVPTLIVAAAGDKSGNTDKYAIPQTSIQEVLRLEQDVNLFSAASPALRLRGKMLPLVSLNRALGLVDDDAPRAGTVVVLQSGEGRFGLIVDAVHDAEAVVVKPLNSRLRSLKLYAGATILGDGEVALILDAAGVARQAGLSFSEEPEAEPVAAPGPPVERVLLVSDAAGNRVAVGVDHVTRIERFPWEAVERAGGKHVVQYRGSIVPIAILPGDSGPVASQRDGFLAVVCRVHEASLALAVHGVLDVADAPLEGSQQPLRAGFTRTAVVDGKVAEFVALDQLPFWMQKEPS